MPSLRDPNLRDPSLCDPSLCDPSLCDPSLRDPSLRDPSLRDPSLGNLNLRDPRLDFFRGLAMFIILIAHVTDNPWNLWMPGRFGFSDATEVFVFCSGMASALAFGPVFARAGFGLGTLRIACRVWQVYWVHIAVFLCGLLAMLVIDRTGAFPDKEVAALNLDRFLSDTGPNVIGLMTLTYVPNYFDVLPMYLVILALVPPVIALSRLHPVLAMGASVALWLVAGLGAINLPAEWWFIEGSTRPWFFNPFAWQVVFFTGFALMSGWLPAPPVNRVGVAGAVVVLLLSVPFAWQPVIDRSPVLQVWRADWVMLFDKTTFGILRCVHFLSVAYLAWIAAGPGGARLKQVGVWSGVVAVVSRVGTQSLAVFAASMVLARILGAVLDLTGRGFLPTLAINLAGFALIVAVAELATVIKRQPWRSTDRVPPADAPVSSNVHSNAAIRTTAPHGKKAQA